MTGRQALWDSARALSAAAGPEMSPRCRRIAVSQDPALDMAAVVAAPDWAADAEARARLVRLAGAVLVSRAWASAIDGAVLGRGAAAVGDAAMDALINLPAVVAPAVADPAAESGDPKALDRLGAGALLAATGGSAGLRARLARGLPVQSRPVEAAAAQTAAHTAASIARELAGAEAGR